MHTDIRQYNMGVNIQKADAIKSGAGGTAGPLNIQIYKKKVKHLQEFNYPGSMSTENAEI